MSEDGRITTDPLFMALTRPAMLLGVTYMWMAVEMLFGMLAFINTSSFKYFFMTVVPMHLIGFMACSHEPRFVELFMIWGKTWPKCLNRSFHGRTGSYDLY